MTAPEGLELTPLAILFLKVTAWCALPFLLRPLLQGISAANRHLFLTLTLAGCLAMPLAFAAGFTWAAPSWLQVPSPAETPAPSMVAPAGLSLPTPSMPPSATAGMPLAGARRGADLRPAETARSLPTASPPAPAPTAAPVEGSPLEKESPTAVVSQLPWPLLGRWAAAGLLLLWCLGTAAALLRLAVHHRRARGLVAASAPILDGRAAQSLAEACRRLGRDPGGELRESQASPVAFAWPNGWLPGNRRRPSAVVLPTSWREWDDERLTIVLVHELAHLVRRDGLALWLGRAAVALWWFHPLVRSLESWARRECEQAADDAVLLSGSRASEYADHLISICRALARPFPVGVSLMLSDGPELKERLLAILRADQPRQVLSRRIAVGASLTVLAAALLVAGIRFAPPVEAGETPEKTEPTQQAQEAQEARQAEQNGGWQIEAEDSEDGADRSHSYSYRVASNQDTKKRAKRSRKSSGDAGEDAYDAAYEAYREDRYDEAAAGFTAAAEAGYRPATATYNAACSLALADRRQEAISTLERAFELGFDDPEHYVEDSDLDRLRSNPRFQALVDHAFATAGRKRDVGRHYRYQRIQNELAALQDMNSQDADSWHRVGTALLQMRELDAAAEALGQAARLDKESPSTSLYNLACAFALDGRQREALEALEFAIQAGYSDAEHLRKDPDLTSLRESAEFERLAQLAHDLDLGRFREAIWEKRHRDGKKDGDEKYSEYSPAAWSPAVDFYRGFTAENPSLGVGWFNLGYALHYSRRHEEAASAFQKARELGYRPATSTYNVACAYSMMDRVEPALDALEEAIELGFDSGFDHDDDLDNLRGNLRFVKLHLQSKVARHFN